jgi:hypothetical protein
MYLPDLWNQHTAAVNGEPRTNNLTEAWHRRFNTLVGKSHPSIYSLLVEMQKEQGNTEREIARIELGRVSTFLEHPTHTASFSTQKSKVCFVLSKQVVTVRQRPSYRVVTERLQRISRVYEEYKAEGRVLDFLRACGHNFTL